jgi:LysR family transcriptional activator of dmlA
MLTDLNELRTFQRILALGSLSAAARDLNLGLAVVSKRLLALEQRTGTRLVNRTTRSLSATDEGLELLAHVERVLEELDAAEAHISNKQKGPRGCLRVSAPISFGRIHLAPVAAELIAQHPNLDIDLKLSDRLIDMTEERIDVAFRIGQPRDTTATMRKLADNRRGLFASPAYLEKFGHPKTLDDIRKHICLRYGDSNAPWQLEGAGNKKIELEARSRLRADNGDVVHDWALNGHGIMLKSNIDVANNLKAGQLKRVLPEWQTASAPIYALFPSSRNLAMKTRVFLESVSARLQSLSI